MRVFDVEVRLAKQEDGLWRASVPGLRGCWVDAPTMEQAITDIQEAVAMILDIAEEQGEEVPPSLKPAPGETFKASIPIDVSAYAFKRPAIRRKKSAVH
jgi:predicted RNase H-like HicB family nuclease